MIKFSIIIPLYNKEDYVRRAVQSILNQACSDYEIIVVDDCSVDNSVEIVKSISDTRMVIIELNENKGVSVARNIDVKNAKNDYVAFLDADDEWDKDHLSNLKETINRFPNAKFFSCAYRKHYNSGVIINSESYDVFDCNFMGYVNHFFDLSKKTPIAKTSCVCVHKDAFGETNGFPRGIKHGEDTDMWCELYLKCGLVFNNKISCTYYLDIDDQVSKQVHDVKYYFVNYAKNKYYSMIKREKRTREFISYFDFMQISRAKLMAQHNKKMKAIFLLLTSKGIYINTRAWLYTMAYCVLGENISQKISAQNKNK